MGLQYRRRIRLTRRTRANVSRSGVSLSHRRGRATVNTRGGFWFRIAKGLFWRS